MNNEFSPDYWQRKSHRRQQMVDVHLDVTRAEMRAYYAERRRAHIIDSLVRLAIALAILAAIGAAIYATFAHYGPKHKTAAINYPAHRATTGTKERASWANSTKTWTAPAGPWPSS
jgi:hypothetical protein